MELIGITAVYKEEHEKYTRKGQSVTLSKERKIFVDPHSVRLIEELGPKFCVVLVDKLGYKVKGSAQEVADRLKIVLK